jgi:RNA exonuclease 4
MDCEMVGVGIEGMESSLARVSVVNWYGAVLIDEYVRQTERVVDYRTTYSGIRAHDLKNGVSFYLNYFPQFF